MVLNVPLSVYLVIVYGAHLAISSSTRYNETELYRPKRQTSCQKNEYECENGECIDSYNKCDGKEDCNDGSDETRVACIDNRCPLKSFQCSYGGCIDEKLRCNEESNCADDSDEKGCTCGDSKFKCNSSSQCIDNYDMCDGVKNCPDDSDETREQCWEIVCPSGSFKCTHTGACLVMSLVCNGVKDCLDGSDEDDKNGCNKSAFSSDVRECGKSTALNKEEETVVPLILSGEEAKVGYFPWHAGLYYRKEVAGEESWQQGCGGSLITDQFVLTAAHCVHNNKEQDVRVALGKYYRSWDREEKTQKKFRVSKIMKPDEFDNGLLVFDIALLMLDRKVELGKYIMPVCKGLSSESNYIVDKKLYVVGWGQTEDVVSGKSSPTLQYNDVRYAPTKKCKREIPSIYPLFDKFCTVKNSTSEDSVAQAGDSGGGMTALHGGLHYIFGIVSLKFKQYTGFTNVAWPTHARWIESEIRKYDSSFKWTEAKSP